MTACPRPESLSALVTDELSDHESALIRAHVLDCPECRNWLDVSTDDAVLKHWAASNRKPLPFAEEAGLARLVEKLVGGQAADEEHGGSPGMLAAPKCEGDLGALGPYRIECELGRGGMGIVYRGIDETLQRTVAIKVPRFEWVEGDRGRRLLREAQIAARFRHENAVSVHAVAETPAGQPYIVMEYVAGASLAELIRTRKRIPPVEAATFAEEISLALQAAHEAGLIHRDVKPANILIDAERKRARIVDFGMARAIDSADELTREGAVGGTPAYMSPEQVVGDPEIDGRADVYGLGASLYEALTGEPPFLGTPMMVVHQILHDEPRPPRRLNEAIPRDLETVCLKAISKEPRHRYSDAAALAADLALWRRGEPVAARPPGLLERIWRWIRRERRVAALAGAVMLLLAALAAGATFAAVRINSARVVAETEKSRADRGARVAAEQRALAFDTVASLAREIQEELGRSPNTMELRGKLADVAIKRLEKVAQISGDDADVALVRIVAHDRMADLAFLVGRTAESRRHHEMARDEAESLAGRADASETTLVEAKRSLARAVDKIGDLDILGYDAKSADACYKRARAIRDAMPSSYRESLVGLREQAVSAQKIGDVERFVGRSRAARDEYARGVALIEATAGLEESQHLADLRFSYSRLGEAQLALFEFDQALESFRKALEYAQAFLKRDANDPKARRAVAAVTNLLGDAAMAMGDPTGALEHYRAYLANRQTQMSAEPGHAENRRDVSCGHSLVAKALQATGDQSGAIEAFRTSLRMNEDLERDDPRSVQKCGDVIEACKSLADAISRTGRFDEAALLIEHAIDDLDKAFDRGIGNRVMAAPVRAALVTELAVYRGAERALADARSIEAQPAGVAGELRFLRAMALARRGRVAEAARAAEDVRAAATGDGENLVRAGRIYAACALALDHQTPGSTVDRARERRAFAEKAVESLAEAIRCKPSHRQVLLTPDVNAIRTQPRFDELLKTARE